MLNPIDRKYNLKNLKEISLLLNLQEIEYFIFYGSLLGYVREKNLLEKDDDIDILVNIKYRKQILKILTILNYKISVSKDVFVQGEKNINEKNSNNTITTYVDFYFYTNNAKKNYICDQWNFSGNYKLESNFLHIPKDIIYPIKTGNIEHIKVNIPAHIKLCCIFLYGENFHIPLKKEQEYKMKIKNNKPIQIMLK